MVRDAAAAKQRLLRVIDESGEDYLYPADYFVVVRLPASVKLGCRERPDEIAVPVACRTLLRIVCDPCLFTRVKKPVVFLFLRTLATSPPKAKRGP